MSKSEQAPSVPVADQMAELKRGVKFENEKNDTWELIHGMNSAIASDSLAFNPLGYRSWRPTWFAAGCP